MVARTATTFERAEVVQPVTNVAEVVTNEVATVTNRMRMWREKNRERNNAYQREYMRQRRARG